MVYESHLPAAGVDAGANACAGVDDGVIPVADRAMTGPRLGQLDPKIGYLVHDEDDQLDQLMVGTAKAQLISQEMDNQFNARFKNKQYWEGRAKMNLPLLDWKRDSAENGCGAALDTLALDETGGKGAANNGGGNDGCVVVDEWSDGTDAVDPGGGVGFVNVFVIAGDNCALLALKVDEQCFD